MANTVLHPGEHLAYELETSNISVTELASDLQLPSSRIRRIIDGRGSITAEIALRLGHFFGTSSRFWMNLQSVYDLSLAQRDVGATLEKLPTFKSTRPKSDHNPESRDDRAPRQRAKTTSQPTEPKPSIPTEGYMRLPAVLAVFPVSRSTWWAGISAGRFPKGVKLGPRITAWKVEDIRRLVRSQD